MDSVDVELASSGIRPTVIIASTLTGLSLHTKTSELFVSPFAPLYRWSGLRRLRSGNLSSSASNTPSSKFNNSPLSSLRLILLSHRAGDISSPTLTASMLTDLRIFPGIPLAYALTTGKVCGAITQTNILDYRMKDQEGDEHHFGAPLSCVEVFLKGEEEEMDQGLAATGEVCLNTFPITTSCLSLFNTRKNQLYSTCNRLIFSSTARGARSVCRGRRNERGCQREIQ